MSCTVKTLNFKLRWFPDQVRNWAEMWYTSSHGWWGSNFRGSLVLDFGIWWCHVKTIYCFTNHSISDLSWPLQFLEIKRISNTEPFTEPSHALSCKFIGIKESVYIRKELNSHRIGFGTTTWPPFHCSRTLIWLPWLHVKSLFSGLHSSLPFLASF